MKRPASFISKLLQQAELNDVSKKIPLTEIAGTGRVLIENHQSIMQYSPQCICVKVCFGCIRVTGKRLRLAQITGTQLVICGDIEGAILFKKDECRRK